RLDESCVEFTSYVDGSRVRFGPGELVSWQAELGADLVRTARVSAPSFLVSSDAVQGGWDWRAQEVAHARGARLVQVLPSSRGSAGEPFGWAQTASAPRPAGWPDDLRPRLVLDADGPPDLLGAILSGADLVEGTGCVRAAQR